MQQKNVIQTKGDKKINVTKIIKNQKLFRWATMHNSVIREFTNLVNLYINKSMEKSMRLLKTYTK